MKLKTCIVLFTFCCVSKTYCYAQFPIAACLQKVQIGYSHINTTAQFTGNLRTYHADSSYTDEYLNVAINTKQAYNFFAGSNFAIKKFNPATCLALETNLVLSTIVWESMHKERYHIDIMPFSGVTSTMGLSLGLSLKTGCDANATRNYNYCGSLGLGVNTGYAFTGFLDNADIQLQTGGYIMAEAGFRALLCLKFRATCNFGNTVYISPDSKYTLQVEERTRKPSSEFSVAGKPSVAFSVLIMPMAWNWRERGWWEETNTSKKMY